MALIDVVNKRQELLSAGYSLVSIDENVEIPQSFNPSYVCTYETYKNENGDLKFICFDKNNELNSTNKSRFLFYSRQYTSSQQGKCKLSDKQMTLLFPELASIENKQNYYEVGNFLIESVKNSFKEYFNSTSQFDIAADFGNKDLSAKIALIEKICPGKFKTYESARDNGRLFDNFKQICASGCYELIDEGNIVEFGVAKVFDLTQKNIETLRAKLKEADEKECDKMISNFLSSDEGKIPHISILNEVKSILLSDEYVSGDAISYQLQNLSNRVFEYGKQVGTNDNDSRIASVNFVKQYIRSKDAKRVSYFVRHLVIVDNKNPLSESDYNAVLIHNKKLLVEGLVKNDSVEEIIDRFATVANDDIRQEADNLLSVLASRREKANSAKIEKQFSSDINIIETMVGFNSEEYLKEAAEGLLKSVKEKGANLKDVNLAIKTRLGDDKYKVYEEVLNKVLKK